MLSIKVIKVGSEDYYLDLAAEDYYFNGGEPPGKWFGRGSRQFGLSGTVQRDHLKRLFQGYHPTSDAGPDDRPGPVPLLQNAGKEDRRAGFDLTFSLPKSISVIWSQASQELQREIVQHCEEALQETLDFVQEAFGFARTGKQGMGELVPADLTFALFQHGTSRACEPQLHWHALLVNAGYCSDGITRSIDPKGIFRNKMLLGAIFRSKVAHKLHKSMGLKAIRQRNEFDIAGVPQEAMDAHSTRRKQILEDMRKKGRVGAVAASRSALETRTTKKHRPRQELIAEWRETNARHGFNDRALEALIRPVETDYEARIPAILEDSIAHMKLRWSHFTAHDLMREVLYVASEYGVPFQDLRAPVDDFLRTSSEIVRIPVRGPARFAATSVLKLEQEMLQQLGDLHQRPGLQVNDEIFIKVAGRNTHLNQQQRAAVRHLTQGTSAIRVVQGYAGTGKTTMLRTAVEAWKKSGFNVVGACFTGAAAEVLQDEIGIPCDTINMTLGDINNGLIDVVKRWTKHTVKQLAREVSGGKTYKYKSPKPLDINRRTIVLVDEAGMVNTRHMKMLMMWANDNKATLVLAGDEAQLPAVEGGSPLTSISRRVGYSMMTEIHRQKDYWARDAAYHLAKGEIAPALELYDKRGLLKVDDSVEDSMARLIRDWDAHSFDCLERCRILTLTNDLAHTANQLAQQQLVERGLLDNRKRRTIADVGDGKVPLYKSHVHVGDRVTFTKSSRTYKVRRGHTGTVLGFTTTTKPRPRRALKVRLDNGRVVNVPLGFKQIRLGYASTVHRVQGGTFDEVFVLLAGGYQNLPTSYVQGTRSRDATHFYTVQDLYDQIAELEESPLVRQMQREVDLSLAADLFVPPTASVRDASELIQKVVQDWQSLNAADQTLIVAPRESDATIFNQECSELQYAMAQVDWEKRRHTDQAEQGRSEMPVLVQDGKRLTVGSRVRFLKKGTLEDSIIQHELGTVTEISPEVEAIEIKLDRNKSVRFAMDKLPPLEHGYAVGVEQAHSQGYRLEHGLLVDPHSFRESTDRSNPLSFIDTAISPHTQMISTVYKPPEYSVTSPSNSFQFGQVQTYMSQQHYNQMAVDWQQKMYSLNNNYSQQMQMDYSHSQISIRRDAG